MKLEEILDSWDVDSTIDRFNLGEELLRISKLHQKYLKWFVTERIRLKQVENELRQLRLELYEFYTSGETKETRDKGWKLPPRGTLLKAEADNYIETNQLMLDMKMKHALQSEKVDALESIIKTFNGRGYNIKSAIEYERFKAGG